jgi:phage gp29-like protein
MSEQNMTQPPVTNEIATVEKDITFLAFQGILRPQDDTLETRGSGKSYKIYDEIERDCHAYGLLQKRKLAVIARPWQVDPASEDPRDVQAADMVRAALLAIGVPDENDPSEQVVVASNFDLVCYNLLDALLKGFAVAEIMWAYDKRLNQIVVREIRPRNQRRFNFDKEYKLRLKTWAQLIPGEEIPPRKFITHTFGAKDGSPYGLGLGSRLFWPVLFKRKDITFWLTFLDKFGSPTAVGKYPNGTSPTDQDKLLSALGAIAQDAGVTIPDGMIIELLEAKRGGTVSYEDFCRYMDEEMTFAVLGESPGSKGSGGALASAAIAREEVRLELVQADSDLLSATLNATLSPWLTAYNCPGARPPKIWRQVKKAEDLKARSDRDKNIFDIGFKPTLAQIEEAYGGEWEPVNPPVKTIGKAIGQVPTDFAESDTERNPLAEETAQLGKRAAAAEQKLIARIKQLADEATDLASLQKSMVASFGDLPQDELVKVMSAGFALAELKGIADVTDGQ